MLLFAILGLSVAFLGAAHENMTAPREVRFYLDEPTCKNKQQVFIQYQGPFYLTENLRLWVCK